MSVFRCKQFSVKQSDSAMKIGTDSVLLGCLVEAQNPKYILDIGTGTGLLALMMAQRFVDAQITAIEIDEAAANEATYNVSQCEWRNRIAVTHQSLEHFLILSRQQFDLIVTNPPYFDARKNYPMATGNRKIARQTYELTFETLLSSVGQLLSENGICWMVLPTEVAIGVIEKAIDFSLFNNQQIVIAPSEGKPANRIIFSLSKQHSEVRTSSFYIYTNDNKEYTEQYKKTIEPFLL